MLQITNASPASGAEDRDAPTVQSHRVADRVRAVARVLGCATLWVRSAGPHLVLGLKGENAFARLTPVGGSSYGLAFRSVVAPERRADGAPSWEPLLLVDELTTVVEHALVGVRALPSDA